MRRAALLVVAAVVSPAIAIAGPKAPTKAEQAIQQLDKELATLQQQQALYAAAKVARKLYEAQRQVSGDGALETLRRKQTLAAALSAIGDATEAAKLYGELLSTAERDHGPESREVLWALMPLTAMYYAHNRIDEVEPLVLRAMAITKKLDGEQSQAYATQVTQYGTLLSLRNELSAAERQYEQALAIEEAIAGSKSSPMLVGAIQILAALYWQTSQQAKAIALYDRAIAITQGDPHGNVLSKASVLWGISAMYHSGGRDDLATPLTKQAIDLFTKEIARLEQDKPDDPQLPALLGELGFNYRQLEDLAKADKAMARAVELDEKQRGFSGWSAPLAEIERAEGKTKEALALYEKAKAQMGKVSPQVARVFDSTIADVLREMGEYKRAEAMIVPYRAYVEKTYGKRHPVLGMTELTMSYVYLASGNMAEAERLLTSSLEIAEYELRNVLKTGTEVDHLVYFERNRYELDTAVTFGTTYAPKSAAAVRLGLTTLLRRKGRVLDAAAASMATIRSKLSADDKKLLDELASARTQLAKLVIAGPAATGGDDYAKEVTALEDQIQRLELQVGQKSAAYRVASQPIELAAVQKRIPKDGRLVEIVNFQPRDPKAPYRVNPILPPRRYAAYVLASKGDPVVVDLGPAPPIDDAIEKFRKAVGNPASTKVSELGHALYALTMAKLVPALGSSTELLLAPDGALNVVPFSALVDDKQEFLVRRYTFTYLTSGRDLLRLEAKTKAQGGGVIFADPSFDATAPTPGAPKNPTRGNRTADLASLSWPQLPGTGEEADAVERTWGGLTEYRGAKATETALKALHGPKILHLATHGFFLEDKARPRETTGPSSQPAPSMYENPLLRSGLAFSGANQLSSGNDDGILTAMEATGLDLWGTKLVVLSACNTGNGKVTNGEGVYGLRRALVIAGAEGLVMSLWQVDDVATRDLMAGYYARLKAGKPRSSALRDIQLEIQSRTKYAHPYYWAAFLAAGDNSPLED